MISADRIQMDQKKLIEEGMVLCVEPGLYFDGQLGVRVEDMFAVTKDGAVLLSDYPHQLV